MWVRLCPCTEPPSYSYLLFLSPDIKRGYIYSSTLPFILHSPLFHSRSFSQSLTLLLYSNIFFKKSSLEDTFLNFRQREMEIRGRNIEVRQKYRLIASHMWCFPWPGMESTTQVCALTGNWTGNLLMHRTTLQPTKPPSQGYSSNLIPGSGMLYCQFLNRIHNVSHSCGIVCI